MSHNLPVGVSHNPPVGVSHGLPAGVPTVPPVAATSDNLSLVCLLQGMPTSAETLPFFLPHPRRAHLYTLHVVCAIPRYRRFIWAEIVYLQMWWAEQSAEMRERLRALVTEGRLEIVSGGWVMPDEASSHYYAMIDQLMEGNQWVLETLGVKPVSSWSVDPFGHSPTMA